MIIPLIVQYLFLTYVLCCKLSML